METGASIPVLEISCIEIGSIGHLPYFTASTIYVATCSVEAAAEYRSESTGIFGVSLRCTHNGGSAGG